MAHGHDPASPASPPPPLLLLPVELRLQIYHDLLVLPLPPVASPSSASKPPRGAAAPSPNTIHAPLLLTNRQINAEATPLLYTRNTFLAHPSLLTALPRLRPDAPPLRNPAHLPLIRRVRLVLRLDADVPFTADHAARALSGLDALAVDATQRRFMECGPANLRVLEGVRGVGAVAVRGSFAPAGARYVAWLTRAMERTPGDSVEPFVDDDDADDNDEGRTLRRVSPQGALVAA